MPGTFVHLHLHTDYSLVDGIVRVKPLVEAVAGAGMPAVAVTDQCNLFALVKFYRAALEAGVKPIVGADLFVQGESNRLRPTRLVLLCQNRAGYLNLTRLISRAYLEGQSHGIPIVQRDWLRDAADGLIALSGSRGEIGQALEGGHRAEAAEILRAWLALFPDRFYLELQRIGRPGEEEFIHHAVDLSLEHGVPLVATNDVRFIRRDQFEAHEARVCIHEGRTLADPRRPRQYTEQQYLRTAEEMIDLFDDLPEAIENTVEIARRCNLELILGRNVLPDFPLPAGISLETYFAEQARAGLERRFVGLGLADADGADPKRLRYEQRLGHEIEVILKMGFAGYFLVVADFIRWAKENGIPVGPGRGSGAGSLVAYALEITDLDPIRNDLLFERFLNPERVSMPDFDIDFCMEGRDRVIDYVARRYGANRVSQIITFGTMAAKAVVRDVGRVLGYPYGMVDKIAKLIPFELGMTLDEAIKKEPLLERRYREEEEVRTLIDLARELEGLVRNAGKHAGGVVIAPSDLTDFTPLYCEQGSEGAVTQFDKDDVEAIGLVKFDFLGLRTLTIIDRTVRLINAREGRADTPAVRTSLGGFDISRLPLDDAATFDLLKRCATTAVFQLESRGMKDLIKRLQPDCFDDITALVALFRPGPLQSGMVDDFIDRKHGARVQYPHPDLEPILKPTYGVILYQEQVMQIAQVLAGYTLGQADLLRRAMGKKKPEEMAKQREVFVSGAARRGVDARTAQSIFDLMEKFAGYGFNKSHSAAYALIAYQTAWLKAHYPAEFMASVLSSDMDNTDKVVALIDECRNMGLEIGPPDINRCSHAFTVGGERLILYGLGAIKGVGSAAVEAIVGERLANGPFKDLFDLCRRIDARRVNRRVLEALIRAGALDVLDPHRARSMSLVGEAMQLAERHSRDAEVGQNDLFGGGERITDGEDSASTARRRSIPQWSEESRLAGEKETLGLYLTGHPIERYREELAGFVSATIAELRTSRPDQTAIVAGLVVGIRSMNSRRGDRMAFVTLDDRTGRIEISVFSEVYQTHRDLLVKDRLLVVEGSVSPDEYTGGLRMNADRLLGIDEARAQYARGLEIDVQAERAANGVTRQLAEALEPFRRGICPVWINYRSRTASARMALGQEWKVNPTDELLNRLGKVDGLDRVRVIYR
jgi:DNA polymerase-3 subunit alpha